MYVVPILTALLLISTHACDARHTPSEIHKNGNSKLENEPDVKSLLTIENTKATFSGVKRMSMMTMLDDEHQSTIQTEGLERKERSMEEDETDEEASNRKDEEGVEDAVVMDYVTPHRKSPIHNHYEVNLP